jgi:hypothetical protein
MGMGDIRQAFIDAGQGYLRCIDATMHLVPRGGEKEHQLVRIVGVHGPTNTLFIINADPILDQHRMANHELHMIEPVPPARVPGAAGANHGGGTSAALLEAARDAANMILVYYNGKPRKP